MKNLTDTRKIVVNHYHWIEETETATERKQQLTPSDRILLLTPTASLLTPVSEAPENSCETSLMKHSRNQIFFLPEKSNTKRTTVKIARKWYSYQT